MNEVGCHAGLAELFSLLAKLVSLLASLPSWGLLLCVGSSAGPGFPRPCLVIPCNILIGPNQPKVVETHKGLVSTNAPVSARSRGNPQRLSFHKSGCVLEPYTVGHRFSGFSGFPDFRVFRELGNFDVFLILDFEF